MEPLDNWVWRALTGPQQQFAEGSDGARRYQPEVSVFAALPDQVTPDSWMALGDLVGPGGSAVLFRDEIGAPPDGWEDVRIGVGLQMVGPAPGAPRPARSSGSRSSDSGSVELIELTPADVPEMLELVRVTKPGPFGTRTIELGTYLGVRDDGELVAMAGQRMRIDGFIEISAVCTRADQRGRGRAGVLVDALIDDIHAQDAVPFLHALESNVDAISRYRSLGFETRREVAAALITVPS